MSKSKVYIIYYAWANTADNHAGMAYLALQIKAAYPETIRLIKVPGKWNSWSSRIKKTWHLLRIVYFKIFLRKNDHILFMEFLGNCSGDQTSLAMKLRRYGFHNKFIGLVHLAPSNLKELYGDDSYIIKSLKTLTKILVFGTSLERYFAELGFREKVSRTFHYVDTNFYQPLNNKQLSTSLRVICMGSLKRNYDRLKEIVVRCYYADFDICLGKSEFSNLFSGIQNVTLHGYLSEKELLILMQQSDISLSVLFDTVGSNVIVTSMACGLVNVVSDVGSIHDYCSSDNSIFCKSSDEFINAIKFLDNNRDVLKFKSNNARKQAMDFSLDNFLKWFHSSFLESNATKLRFD